MTLKEAESILAKKPENLGQEAWTQSAKNVKEIWILKTMWYPELIQSLEESARAYLVSLNIDATKIHTQEIPGSFELALAAQYCSQYKKPDFIVALGCILRGETPHFEYICRSVTEGLSRVQLETGVPIGFGVLTVENRTQAELRLNKGAEAAQAAFWMYDTKQRWR